MVNSPFLLGPYLNLSAASGPNSVGSVLPTVGGNLAVGSIALGTAGYTIEITFKAALQYTWSELMNLGQPRDATND